MVNLDQMVSALWELRASMAPQEQHTVHRMLLVCGEYTPAEAEEIRRLHRLHFGHLSKIKGQRIEDPAGLEDEE
jgi:hypothetical protein